MNLDQPTKTRAPEAGAGKDAARELVAAVFSSLAHDIRAGLNGITLWTHVLERGGPEAAERGLEGIRRAVAQQSELAQQFSDVGRALSPNPDEPVRPFDVLGLLREAAGALESTAAEHGVTLRLACDAQSVELSGHDRPLRQLLHLLLADAVAAAPQGGSVHATLAQRADDVTLELAVLQPDGSPIDEDGARSRRTLRRALAALGGHLLHGDLRNARAGLALRMPRSFPAR
ncbi:MAG TPA: hypothetical protein VFU53_07375 [Burkholderiales bacterium]|nr:hypothetical protein [Burkholderiales bacterium]